MFLTGLIDKKKFDYLRKKIDVEEEETQGETEEKSLEQEVEEEIEDRLQRDKDLFEICLENQNFEKAMEIANQLKKEGLISPQKWGLMKRQIKNAQEE